MSTPEEKKELARIKMAIYNHQPERMAMKRNFSIKRSKARKLETTGKRFQEHSMDELLSIARQRCIDANVDWNSNKQIMEYVLSILHSPQPVLNDPAIQSISAQTTPSPSDLLEPTSP